MQVGLVCLHLHFSGGGDSSQMKYTNHNQWTEWLDINIQLCACVSFVNHRLFVNCVGSCSTRRLTFWNYGQPALGVIYPYDHVSDWLEGDLSTELLLLGG